MHHITDMLFLISGILAVRSFHLFAVAETHESVGLLKPIHRLYWDNRLPPVVKLRKRFPWKNNIYMGAIGYTGSPGEARELFDRVEKREQLKKPFVYKGISYGFWSSVVLVAALVLNLLT